MAELGYASAYRYVARDDRALFWCVLASLALHALAFVALPEHRAPKPRVESNLVLSARLLPKPGAQLPPATSAQPAPEPPIRTEKEAAPSKTTPPTSAPSKAPSTLVEPKTSLEPKLKSAPTAPKSALAEPAKPATPDSAPSSATPPTAPGSQPAAIGGSEAAPQTALASPSLPRAGSEVDAGTLEQYRLSLIVATRRYKRYPAIAMEKGWQGRVEVRMVIGANGMLASASVKSSSGHDILDKQAVDMLKKGKTTIPIPSGLRGKEFIVDVPVIFSLDNPDA